MMFFHKRFFIPIAALAVLLMVSACGGTGGTATTTGSGSTQNSPTPTPTTAPTAAATATSATTGSAVVQTATATVNGKSVTILTNAKGMTLYYFTPDTATTAACSGGCASTWPPLLYTGSGSPTSATTLTGKLSVATNANGNQVLYNGHFLYTYAGDSAPGQTNGEGVAGKWFVATTDVGATKSASGY